MTGLPGNKRARPKHQTPTAADLVDRKFTRDKPNKLWVGSSWRRFEQWCTAHGHIPLPAHPATVAAYLAAAADTRVRVVVTGPRFLGQGRDAGPLLGSLEAVWLRQALLAQGLVADA